MAHVRGLIFGATKSVDKIGIFEIGKVYHHKISKGKTCYILTAIWQGVKENDAKTAYINYHRLEFTYFNKFGSGEKGYDYDDDGSMFELAPEETQESVELLYGSKNSD